MPEQIRPNYNPPVSDNIRQLIGLIETQKAGSVQPEITESIDGVVALPAVEAPAAAKALTNKEAAAEPEAVTTELPQQTVEQPASVAPPRPQPTAEYPAISLPEQKHRRRWALPLGATALVATAAAGIGIFVSPYLMKPQGESTTAQLPAPVTQPHNRPDTTIAKKMESSDQPDTGHKRPKITGSKKMKAHTAQSRDTVSAPHNTDSQLTAYQPPATESTPIKPAVDPTNDEQPAAGPIQSKPAPKPTQTQPEQPASTGGAQVDPYLGSEDTGGASVDTTTDPVKTGAATAD
jgi:hypothetical protein